MILVEKFSVIGQPYARHESWAKVSGRALYTTDMELPGMIYGAILRSPHPRARVTQIDASWAKDVKGVRGVLLPGDVPGHTYNSSGNPPSAMLKKDERILTDHPLYVGDKVAAVAADSPEICAIALEKIQIEYEVLPAILTIKEALAAGAPPLHPDIAESNLFKTITVRDGDVQVGFAESDFIFEEEYTMPAVQHIPLEPTGCLCHFTADGYLTLWATSQTPYQERRLLAELLGLAENRIRVIKPVMGGGFGARQQLHHQPVAALLSRRTGRPVKMIYDREEEMYCTAVRHEGDIRLKAGVNKNGNIHAFQATVYLNAGAYWTHSPIILAAQSRKLQYRVPHYLYEGNCVYTNTPVAGAMRGYGNPQLTFAREVFLDKIAAALDIDPLAFRLQNHVLPGEKIPGSSSALRSCAIRECSDAAQDIKDRIDAEEETCGRGEKISWGLAFGCHTSGPSSREGQSSALVLINDDGSVNILTGSADLGQGCETVFMQIAAEVLGLSPEDISITAADTGCTPYDTGTFASSQMYVGGNAVYTAAMDAKKRLADALALRYKTAASNIYFTHKQVCIHQESEIITLSFPAAIRMLQFSQQGSVITGQGTFKAQESPPPFAVCWARVAADLQKKTFRLLDIIQTVDVGTAVNPQIVKGQVEGGISMGVGYALMEKMEMDRRVKKPLTSSLLPYRAPLAVDMPRMHVAIVDSYEPTGPFGAKSVGELSVVPVAPAIVNAVARAFDERITSLPLCTDHLLSRERGGGD
jgi:CO/xanthine dehydrogenase Mo-binding subunit